MYKETVRFFTDRMDFFHVLFDSRKVIEIPFHPISARKTACIELGTREKCAKAPARNDACTNQTDGIRKEPPKGRKKMKVLIPTEGSDFSKAAIKKCCRMFDESENTEIEIFAVAEPAYMSAEPFAVSADYIHDIDAATLKKATEDAAEAEAEIRKELPGTAGVTAKVVTGSPKQAIVEEAENWGADLIVMGSHGYGFWQRALLGSVSNFVVHHAPCSVLVVRNGSGQRS